MGFQTLKFFQKNLASTSNWKLTEQNDANKKRKELSLP